MAEGTKQPATKIAPSVVLRADPAVGTIGYPIVISARSVRIRDRLSVFPAVRGMYGSAPRLATFHSPYVRCVTDKNYGSNRLQFRSKTNALREVRAR